MRSTSTARWYFVAAIRLEPFLSSSMASFAYFTARDSSSSDAEIYQSLLVTVKNMLDEVDSS